jgi:DNA-binding FadR family transcriptional regulator
VVPDVRGFSAREAMRALARLGLSARMRGDGIVVEQVPEPGTPLEPGVLCALELERHPARLLVTRGIEP